nr:uncharacterized mitochondrial protein AtMg00810-like [Tanacetum cinerariifolium]
MGLWYPKDSPFDLVPYSDSDYGGATKDRKSTTEGCQFLGRRLISWQYKKQTIVATSTTEAGYVAAASCYGQVLVGLLLIIEDSCLPLGIFSTARPNFPPARLQFCDYHNMVAILEKSEHNVGFHPIVDFVEASPLRRNLKLQDEEGINSLPDPELFENLTLMGYNISPNQKFTFQKDEPASPVRDVSQGEACPTDFGFIADQDRATIAKSSTLPHDSGLRVTSPAAEEGRGVIGDRSGDDSPIKGRRIDKEKVATERVSSDTEEVRLDKRKVAAKRASKDTEEMATVLTTMDAATVLASRTAEVPTGSGSIPTGGPPAAEVPTGSDVVPTASPVFATATVVTPYRRRKGKEVMVESKTPKKHKLQEQIDAQIARELKEQLEREDQRRSEQIARDEEISRIHAKEELQIMIDGLDRSNEVISKRLAEYDQAAADLTIGERIELINELVKYQDHHSKILQYQAQQKKPKTKKQKRDFYMAVIRNNLGWKAKDFKGEAAWLKRKGIRSEHESAKKHKISKEVHEEVKSFDEFPEEKIKEMMQLVHIEEVYVEALQVKHPIIDWEVHTEGQRAYCKITRLGGSSASYQFFTDLLKHLDRDDLNWLWSLVKETLTEWKLYDKCRVHQLNSKDIYFHAYGKGLPPKEGSSTCDDLLQALTIKFSLPKELPTASEDDSHCQKKRDATARKIALLSKTRRNCQSKKDDSYTKLVPHVLTLILAVTVNYNIVQLSAKDKTGLGYGDQLSESNSEVLPSVFGSRSSDDDDNPTNDRFKKSDVYHAVPLPLTRNYMPPLANLSFAGLDDSVYRPTANKASASISKGEPSVIKTSNISVKMPKVDSVRTSGVIINYWVSDDEDTLVDTQVDSQTTVKPSFKKIKFTKARNESVKFDKQADNPKMVTQNSKGIPQQALKYKGMFNSGCSRHMKGNKALLTDYQDIDGGFVAFGRSTKGGKITGKFDGKNEEGFLVGYSVNSKAFRVFNTQTKKVEENLHVNFLENKPNVARQGPNWIFDIDSLENFMNYQPITTGNQANENAGHQEVNGDTGLKKNVDVGHTEQEKVSTQQYIMFPLWSSISSSYKSSNDKAKDNTAYDAAGKEKVQEPVSEYDQALKNVLDRMMNKEKEATEQSDDVRKEFQAQCNSQLLQEKVTRSSSTNSITTGSTPVNTTSASRTFIHPHDPLMPELEDTVKIQTTGIFGNAYDEDDLETNNHSFADKSVGAEADFNNIEPFNVVSPIPTTRVHSNHPKAQIIGDPMSTVQTREEVYVSQPPGFVDPEFPKKVYKVEKALYGLHQAPRAWYETLFTYLLDKGFHKGQIDKTLFIKRLKGDILLVQVYVDDIIFGSTKKSLCDEFEQIMHNRFPMSSMGELAFFLGYKSIKEKMESSLIRIIKRIFRYLKGQPKLGLWYPKDSSITLEAFLTVTIRMPGWTGNPQQEKKIHVDNESSICVIKNPVYHSKTKHNEIRHHFIRDSYEKRLIEMVKIHTDNNVVNLLTKAFDSKFILSRSIWIVFLGRLLPHARGLGFKPRREGFPSGAKKEWGLSPKAKVRVLHTAQLDVTTSAKVKKINDEVQIQALVDGKRVNIKESSIRRILRLDDAEGTGFSREVTPLFDNMLLQAPKKVGILQAGAQPIPIPTKPSTSKPQKKHKLKRKHTKEPEIPPTESQAEHNVPLPSPSHDPLPNGEDSLKLKELMDLCTNLSNKVLSLESEVIDIKSTYKAKIEKLERKVKRLEEENMVSKELKGVYSIVDSDEPVMKKEESSKQGRKIAVIDADVLSMLDVNDEEHAGVEEVVTAAKLITEVVTTAGVDVNAASVQDTPITVAEATKVIVEVPKPRKRKGVIIQDHEEITTTVTVQQKVQAKDKGKAILIKEPKPLKRSKRLTDAVMKYQDLKRKPLTEAQARRNMIVYLKNMADYKMNYFKGMSYDEIRPLFEKYYNYNQAFLNEVNEGIKVPEKEIVPDDDDDVYADVTPLASKIPIVDYKIHTEINKPYFKIIRADGNHKLFMSFSTMLKKFDREDLESLWKIVRERFEKTEPKNYIDDYLLNTLKIMFEKPNVEANVWKEQKGKYGLVKVKSWKLFDSCRVHCLNLLTTQMFLLVKKMYPLTHFTLEQMVNDVRLEVDYESEMSLELLRLVER